MQNKTTISPRDKILTLYIALALITLAVFWQVSQFDFVFDDVQYVTGNHYVKSGITWDGFSWAFTSTMSNLWNPLVWLSLMLDNQLFGLNAGGYHMTNLILHILNVLLLFWLFNRMTHAVWESAFIAALFALHPMHVESVAWITERKDVLSVFFWMLTLCFYVYYTEKPVLKRYLIVFCTFVLALMSKPMVITLPMIMILLDYWPLRRFDTHKGNYISWQLKEKIPFLILSVIIAGMTLYVMYAPDIKYFPLSSRLANAPISFMTYLEKTFWPHDMAAFYPFPGQIPTGKVVGAVLLVAIISTAVLALAKSLPHMLTGWLWYIITILPVIGIIQNGYYAMADRYHYLPSIGITVMFTWSLSSLIQSKDIRKKVLWPAGITVLAILAFLSWNQNRYWRNDIELWNHALNVTKNNFVAHNNLGTALFVENKTNQAIYHYIEAIKFKNDHYYAYNNRGNAYVRIGEYQRAIADYNKAISLNANYVDAYYNMGNAYNKLGQYNDAIINYSKAIRIAQDYAAAYNNRGNAYTRIGNYRSAIADYNKAIGLNHNNINAFRNRIHAYFGDGDNVSGCRDAQKVCELGNCIMSEVAKSRGLCNSVSRSTK